MSERRTNLTDTSGADQLARLSDLMIGSGMVAGWNMDKDRAFGPWAYVIGPRS